MGVSLIRALPAIVLLLAFPATQAIAQLKPVRFQGGFEIIAKTGTCPKYDPVGQRGLARYRPEVAQSNNGPGASFLFFSERSTKGFRLAAGNFNSTAKAVQTMYVEDEWAPDPAAGTTVRFTAQAAVPAGAIGLATKTVRITGIIARFDQMPACSVTFRMALSKFVDAVASASVARGLTVSNQCRGCHNFDNGGPNLFGPNLWNVVNRRVASVSGYSYSTALTTFAGTSRTWTFDELDLWLTSPMTRVPSTKMTFAGVANEQQRADLVAYLRTLAPTPAPLTVR